MLRLFGSAGLAAALNSTQNTQDRCMTILCGGQ